jgi:hypothetical protein
MNAGIGWRRRELGKREFFSIRMFLFVFSYSHSREKILRHYQSENVVGHTSCISQMICDSVCK